MRRRSGEKRMRDLGQFRAAVRNHRRVAGRSQQQLARSVGLHPDMLSHKLNGSDHAVLTAPDVVSIVTTLAEWGALASQAEVHALLGLMDLPPHAIAAEAWSAPPLLTLQPADQRLKLRPARLPAPATPLIGRERERAEVAAALAASRLVTLTGAGGTGKTRLATQVAWDLAGGFADGATFVDLAPVRNPALFATTIAGTLGLAPMSAEAAEGHLVEALRDRELLLVTDNLEHLLEETQLLARLLTAVPGLRLLATSRIPLRLYGEQTVRVPPLHLPGDDGPGAAVGDSEAVRLFITRARAVRSDFDPQAAELAAVGEICTALDGLPLAIELAAARIRLHSPSALLPRLRSRLAVLTGGPRDLPHRQQTLRAALDWSYDLLAPDAQRLFACLGVLAGAFDAAAAAAVSGEPDPVATLDRLADLADQSLLEVTTGDVPAFRMLQTVQEYSLARLAETGAEDAVRHRHLAHFLAVAPDADGALTGPGQAKLLDQLELAYPNLRAALEFAYIEGGRDAVALGEGLGLAAALSPLWQQRGPLAEGVLQLDRLLACDDMQQRVTAPPIRVAAVLAACTLACFQGDYERTADLARHGIELCTPLEDHKGLARAHRFLGEAALALGHHASAEPHFQRQRDEASLIGELSGLADAYNMLGQPARYRGQFGRAQQLLWQSVKFARAANNPSLEGVVLCSLGEVARDAGRPVQARRLYRAALRRHAALGNKRHMAYEFEGLAAAAGLEQAGPPALVYLGAAQALRDETGGPLPPAEQAILDRILAPALVPLSVAERRDALSQGRNQPLVTTVAQALGTNPGEPT
jgi:predicted ATPase